MDDFAPFDVLIVAVRGAEAAPGVYNYPHDLELDVHKLDQLFRAIGARHVQRVDPTDSGTIKQQLRAWAEQSDPASTIIYWLGHGAVSNRSHFLITTDTKLRIDQDDTVPARSFAARLRRNADLRSQNGQDTFTVLILDCCRAADAVIEIDHDLDGALPDLALVATVGESATSYGFGSNGMSLAIDALGPYAINATVWRLLDELVRSLERHGAIVRFDKFRRDGFPLRLASGGVDEPIAATQDVLQSLIELLGNLEPEVRSHFLERAQGAEMTDQSWYFRGRDAETRELVRWLRTAHQGMFVVTGRAGTGKSAFVGRIVTLSDPRFMRRLVQDGLLERELPEDQVPPEDCFDVVVHLTGKSLGDTTARIAERTPNFVGDKSSVEDVVRSIERLGDGGRMFTILVDALDEATQPMAIAESLLRRLGRLDNVRVIIGTRRSLNEDPDHPEPPDHHLLDRLAIRTHDRMLILEDEPEAQHAYIYARLTRSGRYDSDSATRIADKVIARKGPFLFARLAAIEIEARHIGPDDPQLDKNGLLDGGHVGLFASALARFDADNSQTTPLLRALAYSFGRGFPTEGTIWLTAARALHPHLELTSEHPPRALVVAAPYIAVDGEHGQTTRRLAHRTFVEHFLAESEP